MLNLIVFCSGEGSSFMALDVLRNETSMPFSIKRVVCNNRNSLVNQYCQQPTAPNLDLIIWDKENNTREEYEQVIYNTIKEHLSGIDYIFFLGWNFIVSNNFIDKIGIKILNLHPALPNKYIGTGNDCIENSLKDSKFKGIKYTGSMIHEVTHLLDRGKVLDSIKVPIREIDNFTSLKNRIKSYEKGMLFSVITQLIKDKTESSLSSNKSDSKVYVGKVRTVEDIGYNTLLLTASDRLSAFDNHVCNVPGKGFALNGMSEWWFNQTRCIIDNHFLYSKDKYMVVKKTRPIKLEIVVRAYMTGSSSTSIMKMYQSGKRDIYGITFRDGYRANEKLDNVVITPTTKGKHDHPITPSEIVEQGYLTKEEYDFISDRALKLFEFGQTEASKKGLILVDTKYEFGRLPDGKIILIDEIHTCDSSRYWLLEDPLAYNLYNPTPQKLDKDIVRDYIKKNNTQDIPSELIQRVSDVYAEYLMKLEPSYKRDDIRSTYINKDIFVEDYFQNHHPELVVIIAGSKTDEDWVNKIRKELNNKYINNVAYYSSAHKNTREVLTILDSYKRENLLTQRKIVYITVAGRSNALSGVVASNVEYPVFAVPPYKDKTDFQVNINSTLQCPSKVPVMTVLEPGNVAIAIEKIFRL
tara:strand:+ start:1131 stop:3044 length:1914 start_codon:yes stop_codon:yes gene_type:complete